jgi:hypothetical protein
MERHGATMERHIKTFIQEVFVEKTTDGPIETHLVNGFLACNQRW